MRVKIDKGTSKSPLPRMNQKYPFKACERACGMKSSMDVDMFVYTDHCSHRNEQQMTNISAATQHTLVATSFSAGGSKAPSLFNAW